MGVAFDGWVDSGRLHIPTADQKRRLVMHDRPREPAVLGAGVVGSRQPEPEQGAYRGPARIEKGTPVFVAELHLIRVDAQICCSATTA